MGVLRITGPSPLEILRKRGAVAQSTDRQPSAWEAYTNNLTKLIPGEALSLYALGGSVSEPPWVQEAHLRIWPAICLLVAILFRLFATNRDKGFVPQLWAVGIAAISFVLWIYAQDSWILYWQIDKSYTFLLRYAVILWTFLIPLVASEKQENRAAVTRVSGDVRR
jgi:hypothetical protein